MIRQKTLCVSAALAALMFVGCKPTEKNYREAYDAALARRREAAAEQMRPATGLLSDDGPQLRMIDGDSVFLLRERLYELDGTPVKGRWSVAVGLFRMDTNAKASAETLRQKGFPKARAVKSKGGKYYTVSAETTSLDSARIAAKVFETAMPEYPYVGLPGSPVMVGF